MEFRSIPDVPAQSSVSPVKLVVFSVQVMSGFCYPVDCAHQGFLSMGEDRSFFPRLKKNNCTLFLQILIWESSKPYTIIFIIIALQVKGHLYFKSSPWACIFFRTKYSFDFLIYCSTIISRYTSIDVLECLIVSIHIFLECPSYLIFSYIDNIIAKLQNLTNSFCFFCHTLFKKA